jgi:pseudouridine 5'-phosphatase
VKLSRLPRAVIFDLDGVLLDTEPLYTQALSSLVAQFGKQYTWELKSRTMGTHPRSSARLVIDTLGLPIDIEEYLRLREERLCLLFAAAPAMPGAAEWVQQVSAQRIPIAIATSSERALCELKWSTHAWLREIPVVICGDDPGLVNLKPAPDIYLAAAARLGIAAEHCLVFEDSPAGVTAGKAAGMQVIALKAPQLDLALVKHADWVVSGYAEVSLQDCGWV